MINATESPEQLTRAYHAGRQAGFGIAAVALGAVAFISLLGVEKAILAAVLGILAVRGSEPGTTARRHGITAIVLSTVFAATVIVLLAVFQQEFAQFLALLNKLS